MPCPPGGIARIARHRSGGPLMRRLCRVSVGSQSGVHRQFDRCFEHVGTLRMARRTHEMSDLAGHGGHEKPALGLARFGFENEPNEINDVRNL